ncbi:MAG: DNA repair protein RadA [Spirochaetaceae bacterium]|nr:DNA repair protein RadA [Spirochaetaceae bacterium]
MAKKKTIFECIECGHQDPKWLGRCPSCGGWNTMEQQTISSGGSKGLSSAVNLQTPGLSSKRSIMLNEVDVSNTPRFSSGYAEVDRVLGGGIMMGSAILLGGEPGIGKSTLMMQVAGAAHLIKSAKGSGKILYISGEESASQLKMRADRLRIDSGKIEVLIESNLDHILEVLEDSKPELIIVDSIQTTVSEEAGKVPGTVNQVKFCGHSLISWSKNNNAAVFFIAHVTKEGVIAGPKIVEHMVDTVLYFDHSNSGIRFVRAAKNRFGSVDELGLFTMEATGLREVKDPSTLFLIQRDTTMPPGIAAVPVFEGSRALMVEIQALTVPAKSGFSRIYSDKIDNNRVSRIAAVLEKNLNLRFSDQDIYVNVAGGMKLNEVGIELALACALYSARTGIAFPTETAAAGEISLAGEIRPTAHMERRIKTAIEMGYKRFIGPIPVETHGRASLRGIYTGVRNISESIKIIFGKRS